MGSKQAKKRTWLSLVNHRLNPAAIRSLVHRAHAHDWHGRTELRWRISSALALILQQHGELDVEKETFGPDGKLTAVEWIETALDAKKAGRGRATKREKGFEQLYWHIAVSEQMEAQLDKPGLIEPDEAVVRREVKVNQAIRAVAKNHDAGITTVKDGWRAAGGLERFFDNRAAVVGSGRAGKPKRRG